MKAVHTVRFEIEERYGVTPIFRCFASAGDPICRMYCPNGECKDYVECSAAGHELRDNGKCLFIEWMTGDDTGVYSYAGEKSPVRGGMIIAEWNSDYWQWRYPQPGELYR